MRDRFYQNFNEDFFMSLSSKIIEKREFAALSDLNDQCSFLPHSQQEIDNLSKGFELSKYIFPIFYIYYLMLDDKEREIFKDIQQVVVTYSLFISRVFIDQLKWDENYLETTLNEILDQNPLEVPYFDLFKNFLYYYIGDEEKISYDKKTLNENFMKIEKNDFQKVRDDFYLVTILGLSFDKDFLLKLMPLRTIDYIKKHLYETVLSVINNSQNQEEECVDFDILSQDFENDINNIHYNELF